MKNGWGSFATRLSIAAIVLAFLGVNANLAWTIRADHLLNVAWYADDEEWNKKILERQERIEQQLIRLNASDRHTVADVRGLTQEVRRLGYALYEHTGRHAVEDSTDGRHPD